MPNIEVKIRLFRGKPVPMHRMAKIVEALTNLLSVACEENGVTVPRDAWVDMGFSDGSMNSGLRAPVPIDDPQIAGKILADIHGVHATCSNGMIARGAFSPRLFYAYGGVAHEIPPGEDVDLGLVYPDRDEDWVSVRAEHYEAVRTVPSRIAYSGGIQGRIETFRVFPKNALRVRELSTRNLVTCEIHPDEYDNAIELLSTPGAVIFFEGKVVENLITGAVERVHVSNYYPAPEFTKKDFDAFFGMDPNFTDSLSTEDYIQSLKDRDE